MKARVKYNNEIIDVVQVGTKSHLYDLNNVEFIDAPEDYWTRLEHQAAIGAMQGILSNQPLLTIIAKQSEKYAISLQQAVANDAYNYAHALVEKMKEERK